MQLTYMDALMSRAQERPQNGTTAWMQDLERRRMPKPWTAVLHGEAARRAKHMDVLSTSRVVIVTMEIRFRSSFTSLHNLSPNNKLNIFAPPLILFAAAYNAALNKK